MGAFRSGRRRHQIARYVGAATRAVIFHHNVAQSAEPGVVDCPGLPWREATSCSSATEYGSVVNAARELCGLPAG